MKITCLITGAALGAAAGALVGSMAAPKRKRVRCTTMKAAKAVAAMVESITSSFGI